MKLCIPGTNADWRRVVLCILVAVLAMPASFAPASVKAATPGAVFALTNNPAGNTVAIFQRAADGTLTADGQVRTQGFGVSGGLASQGALVLSRGDNRFLFAVNGGSNQVTVFRWDGDQLRLTDVVASGGDRPVSVTSHQDLVYVLNAGGEGSITGFRVSQTGKLTRLSRSPRPLELTSGEPFQVQFAPSGQQLVVTIQGGPVDAGAAGGSRLVTFPVRSDGRLGTPRSRPSVGSDPTGFAFAPGRDGPILLVTEAFREQTDTGGIASYQLRPSGNVIPVDHEAFDAFNCWVAFNPASNVAYASSPESATITRYAVGRGGGVRLLGDGIAASTPARSTPTELALDQEGRFLYVLLPGIKSVGAFAIQPNGRLDPIPGSTGGLSPLPTGAVGLAAL